MDCQQSWPAEVILHKSTREDSLATADFYIICVIVVWQILKQPISNIQCVYAISFIATAVQLKSVWAH